MKCKSPGFTLIELLVVIAIIAILAAILFPVFSKARDKAHSATCQSNLKQIALATIQYCDDFDGFGPYNSCPLSTSGAIARLGGYGVEVSQLSGCKYGPYAFPYYRGGHCMAGPTVYTTPWGLDTHPSGSRVIHPARVMLCADARGGLPGTPDASYFYDLDGAMTPRHQSVVNQAYCDGHVKGVTPGWLKDEVDNAGAADPSDGHIRGAWYWWFF